MRLIFIVTGAALFFGCKKNENNCMPASKSFSYQVNKSIDSSSAYDVAVATGNKTVFQFRDNFEVCPGLNGAGTSQVIYFDVPGSNQSDFRFADSTSLANASTIYLLNAPISPSLRRVKITSGSIEGTRVSQLVWHVKALVKVRNETMQFEADFVRAD